jgi:hypothetical protein
MANLNSVLDNRGSRGCPQGSRWRRAGTLGACALGVFMVAACDGLLEVELPGQLRSEDLDDPALAEVLVRSVQSDFDCALSTYVMYGGLWGHDFYQSDNFSRGRLTQLRSDEVLIFDQDECDVATFPQLYLPFQIARFQGEDAVERIEGFEPGSVEDPNFLIGKAYAYSGYAYQIMSETMCELAFDGGPLVSRAAGMELAKARFTSAINFASLVTTGTNAVEAAEIVNMALVGRARARLNLGGDVAGVLADAGAVTAGFVRYADMDGGDSRRYNRIYDENERNGGGSTVHPSYFGLLVGAVPDPRVVVDEHPEITAFDNISQIAYQQKYASLDADIPFSSWREAQLMIAEVDPTQTVAVINSLRATWPTIAGEVYVDAGATANFAALWEERRRELFLQGTKIGDILRINVPSVTTDDFETGLNQRNAQYGPNTCYPLPDQEVLAM